MLWDAIPGTHKCETTLEEEIIHTGINGKAAITIQHGQLPREQVTGKASNPVELPAERIPENYYQFRRIVYSGHNDVCSDISDTVHLRDFPHNYE